MSRWLPLWLLLCIGLSAGVNHLMKPGSPYALSVGERTMSTGNLSLRDGARRHEYKLITVHVVAADIPRLLAEPRNIRELWLRSPEQDGAEPDFELFVDFTRDGQAGDPEARDIGLLRMRVLPIAAHATGDEARISQVRLPGAAESVRVAEGQLVIEEALELEKGNPAHGWRIRGTLQLSLLESDGLRNIEGELNARLVWD